MCEALPERLAREAVRRNLPDVRGADLAVDDEMLPVVYSGMYQLAVGVARAALDEAAKVAASVPILHRESRQHPGEMLPDGLGTRTAITTAIARLKGEPG